MEVLDVEPWLHSEPQEKLYRTTAKRWSLSNAISDIETRLRHFLAWHRVDESNGDLRQLCWLGSETRFKCAHKRTEEVV